MNIPVRVGTSGIVVPGSKLGFPEEYRSGSRLHYYGSLFNTLEINSSFYKIPLPTTFARWETEVPQDFTFTVKVWRGITHSDNLHFNREDVSVFMRSVNAIQQKRGCLLIQFPASISVKYREKVEALIQQVNLSNKANRWKLVVELRHASWYQQDIYRMLNQYGVALVFHDMPKSKTPLDYMDPELVYCRFHGPSGDYRGSYHPEIIQQYAARIKEWAAGGREVYVYFNNTIDGALKDAQLLKALM